MVLCRDALARLYGAGRNLLRIGINKGIGDAIRVDEPRVLEAVLIRIEPATQAACPAAPGGAPCVRDISFALEAWPDRDDERRAEYRG